MTCTFPICRQEATHGHYCYNHYRLNSKGMPKPEKEKKPIPKRSEKMKETMKDLKKLYTEFLAKPGNQKCKIGMPGCTGKATVVHHSRGRVGQLLTDEKHFLPSCPSCNNLIESQDAEAREKGHKKTKYNLK